MIKLFYIHAHCDHGTFLRRKRLFRTMHFTGNHIEFSPHNDGVKMEFACERMLFQHRPKVNVLDKVWKRTFDQVIDELQNIAI